MSQKEVLGQRLGNEWRKSILLITFLLLVILFLYQQTFIYLIDIWNQLETGEYAHGYLVLLISVYLIYDKRQQLKQLIPCPNYTAILAVIPAMLLWMVAALVDIEVLQSAALLLLVMAIVWLSFGTQVSRVLAFPVLYTVFALPIWFPLSPILQNLTADTVFWAIRLIEVPALREGNIIIVPAGMLSVEEACSGLRYLLAALTLGTLYAYLNYQTLRSKITVVLIFACAAIFANIVRVFIIVYLAYETAMQHPLVEDHLTLGWYIFGGVIIVLLLIDLWFHKMNSQPAVIGESVTDTLPCGKRSKSQSILFTALAVIMITIGPAMVTWSSSQHQVEKFSYDSLLSVGGGEWTAADSDDDWTPLYQGAETSKFLFQDDSYHKVHLFLGVYQMQKQGYELINDLNHISDGKIWQLKYQRARRVDIGGHQVLEQLMEKNDGTQRLVWYWYRVAERNTVNKYVAKALQLKGLLMGEKRASVIAIATRLEQDPELVRDTMTQFIEQVQSPVNVVIDGGS